MRRDPERDCGFCPRLQAFRDRHRQQSPDWHNSPVPSFGDTSGRLLVVGLAPGLQGANRTGRPFTGDYAGDLLFATLARYGLSTGTYARRPDDGLSLHDALVTNAVRCVPPENKPTPAEITTCRPYLIATMTAMPHLSAIVALGRIAHESVVRALGAKLSHVPFSHGARHTVGQLTLFDSYHCSRYNTNTGVLTEAMFAAVFADVKAHLDQVDM